jgi:hypothetical protein
MFIGQGSGVRDRGSGVSIRFVGVKGAEGFKLLLGLDFAALLAGFVAAAGDAAHVDEIDEERHQDDFTDDKENPHRVEVVTEAEEAPEAGYERADENQPTEIPLGVRFEQLYSFY